VPSMVPIGSPPMYHAPVQMTGPVPHIYLPQVTQLNCGMQAMSLGAAPSPIIGTGAAHPQLLPMMSCNSMHSMDSYDNPSLDLNMSSSMSDNLGLPFVKVGSMDSYPSMQQTPSPNQMGFYPSTSPPQMMMMPTISLIPASSRPLPATLMSGVTVTGWDSCSNYSNTTEPILSPPSDPNMLGLRGNSRSRSPSTRSLSSRARSVSGLSDHEREREYSAEPAEPSKRELVNRAFAKLQAMFGNQFDQDGNRGENILRLKVKTRTALEEIVPFIEFCQQENLIVSVSCPISTKKGRQQVRGFLAYLQTKNAQDADRVEELIQQYNACNGSPFNTWHRNPPSTWKTQA